MGHLGLSLIGSVMIFFGFNVKSSAAACGFLAVCFLPPIIYGRETRRESKWVYPWIVVAAASFLALAIAMGVLISQHNDAASALQFIEVSIAAVIQFEAMYQILNEHITMGSGNRDVSQVSRSCYDSDGLWTCILFLVSTALGVGGTIAGWKAFHQVG